MVKKMITSKIIPFKFQVIIFKDPKELEEEFNLEALGITSESINAAVFTFNDVPRIAIPKNGECSLGLIVHEVNHLLNMAFLHIGQELDLQNDELQSYFMQYFFEEVYKVYLKA